MKKHAVLGSGILFILSGIIALVAFSGVVSAATLATPVVTTKTSALCGGSIELSLTRPVGSATSFAIYRAPSTGGALTLIATVPSTSGTFLYTDRNLTPSTLYSYRVQARSSKLTSAQSATKSAMSSARCPDAPVNPVNPVPPPPPEINLSKVEGCADNALVNVAIYDTTRVYERASTTFQIYRAVAGSSSYTLIGSIPYESYITHYRDRSFVPGTNYSYYVVATLRGLASSQGSPKSVTAPAVCQKIETPTNFKVSPAPSCGNRVTLTWDAPKNGRGYNYQIYRSLYPQDDNRFQVVVENSVNLIPYSTSTYSFTLSTPPTGTVYYKIRATDPTNAKQPASDFTPIVGSVGSGKCLTAPVVRAATASSCGGKTNVSWNAIAGATGYRVYASPVSTGAYKAIGVVTSTTFVASSAPRTIQYYKVAPMIGVSESPTNSVGVSAPSSIECSTGQTLQLRSSGSLEQCSFSTRLSWDTVPGVAEYRLYRVIGPNSAVVYTGDQTSFDVMTYFGDYSFYVVYVDDTGKENGKSNIVRVPSSNFNCPLTTNVSLGGWNESVYEPYIEAASGIDESWSGDGDTNGNGYCEFGERCYPSAEGESDNNVFDNSGLNSSLDRVGDTDIGIAPIALNPSIRSSGIDRGKRYLNFIADFGTEPSRQLPPDCFESMTSYKDSKGRYLPSATSSRMIEDATTKFDLGGNNKFFGVLMKLDTGKCKDKTLAQQLTTFSYPPSQPFSDKATFNNNVMLTDDSIRLNYNAYDWGSGTFANFPQGVSADIPWADKYQFGVKSFKARYSGELTQKYISGYTDYEPDGTEKWIKTEGSLSMTVAGLTNLTEVLEPGNAQEELRKTGIFKGTGVGSVSVTYPKNFVSCESSSYSGTFPVEITVDLTKAEKVAAGNSVYPYTVDFTAPINVKGSAVVKEIERCDGESERAYEHYPEFSTQNNSNPKNNIPYYSAQGTIGGKTTELRFVKKAVDGYPWTDCPPPWSGSAECPVTTTSFNFTIDVVPERCYTYALDGVAKYNDDCTPTLDNQGLSKEESKNWLALIWENMKSFVGFAAGLIINILS